ncbi:M48 family metalloprotease [Thioalkalivibrio versutus]|uniref:M48 family metalloprotease n=1 Tax=Thioalkalivibrio versutus TaxID=106634 RepID=UPI00037EB2D8|nr:M48 family metalloprotease [Thioalkalivibrio versutus]OOC49024.1 peptidase M48 [Thioalkalivibrio versutus]
MNFFEQQEQAQRRTRWLLALFGLAVLVIVGALGLIVWAMGGGTEAIAWTMGITAGLIVLASLYRGWRLRAGGGGLIAQEMGGIRVDGNPADPQRRQLRNVVEEMAIASGVPVPDIYVLEQDLGINAFAAGFASNDAVIAVTRGALDSLERAELKGVVAHEFGHILNGDMRLNMRLIGILYGIEILALLGQGGLARRRRRHKGDMADTGVGVLSVTLIAVGYAGLALARWIRAGISRQREYLADAHAVQFTREPDGLAGALKKVAARYAGLNGNTEEITHMLFASDAIGQIFETHPPLLDRIRTLQPHFEPRDLQRLRDQLNARVRQRAHERAVDGMQREREGRVPGAEAVGDALGGHPALTHILGAGMLLAAIPGPLAWAARSDARAIEVVLYLLLHADPDVRERQLMMIAEALGEARGEAVRRLQTAEPALREDLRLPLLELGFPMLRRLSAEERARLQGLVERLIHADGRVAVFEYALGRMLSCQLRDVQDPAAASRPRTATLDAHRQSAHYLLAVLAHHGHPDDPAAARAALTAGIGSLDGALPLAVEIPEALTGAAGARAWANVLDRVLEQLDALRMRDKDPLIRAMVTTVSHGGQVVPAEVELLRVMAASLHVPLPLATEGLFDGLG